MSRRRSPTGLATAAAAAQEQLDRIEAEINALVDAGDTEAAYSALERLGSVDADAEATAAATVRATFRLGDADPRYRGLFSSLLDEMASAAIDSGLTDQGEALEWFEALIAMCSRWPELRVHGASLGYNRAAALRTVNNREAAAEAYEWVIETYSAPSDDTSSTDFWLGLAAYNYGTFLLEQDDVAATALRLPALTELLVRRFRRSADPRLRYRARRLAGQAIWFFESTQDHQGVIAARERVAELFEEEMPDLMSSLDTMDPIDPGPGSPGAPTSRRDIVLTQLGDLDDLLDECRQLGSLPEEQWLNFVAANPRLLSFSVMAIVSAVHEGRLPGAEGGVQIGGDPDAEAAFRRGAEALASLAAFLESDGEFPVGLGPIEELLGAVDSSISFSDALVVAAQVRMVSSVAEMYLHQLSRSAMSLISERQDLQTAERLHLLIMAVAERLPASTAARDVTRAVRLQWLFVARQVLRALPDAAILRSAVESGERLIAELTRGGEDKSLVAEVYLALGALYVEPLNIQHDSELYPVALLRWVGRLDEIDREPVETISMASARSPSENGDPPQLPGLEEWLDVGVRYLLRGQEMQAPEQEAHFLGELLSARGIGELLGKPANPEGMRSMARRLLECVDADRYPQLLAQGLIVLAGQGERPESMHIERLLARPVEELASATDALTAAGVVAGVAPILALSDRRRALQLVADCKSISRSLDETTRIGLLRQHGELLFDRTMLPTALVEAARNRSLGGLDALAIAEEMLAAGRAHGWDEEQTAIGLLSVAKLGAELTDNYDEAESWLRLMDTVLLVYPTFELRHGEAVRFLIASGWDTVAKHAGDREVPDYALAFGAVAASLEPWLDLEASDAALEVLTILLRIATETEGKGLVCAASSGLAGSVVRCENALGEPAVELLQSLWSIILANEADAQSGAQLSACLQLAKGARFSAALRSSIAYDARNDELGHQLLGWINELEGHADATAAGSDLDQLMLTAPYSDRAETHGRVEPSGQLRNLKRYFERHVQQQLTQQPGATWQFADLVRVRERLGPTTLLLNLYLCSGRKGQPPTLVNEVVSTGANYFVRHALWDAETSSKQLVVGGPDGVVLDATQVGVDYLRLAVLEEPGPRRFVSRDGAAALADFMERLLGPAWEVLEGEAARGRDHLAIIPHGPLSYVPFHLLTVGGAPLTDHWKVSYLPSIAVVDRDRPKRRRRFGRTTWKKSVCSIGVGSGFGGQGLAPLPEAEFEAARVAAAFGQRPIIGSMATKDKLLEALESHEFVHIATHGRHDPLAPSFQQLVAFDSVVSAHEILARDLSRLDLLTLSACETALGRFDASGGHRGIPASALLRGTSTVVGTLWPVETASSAMFFAALYETLRAGAGRFEAFNKAQELCRVEHPEYRDWGAFYYMGEW